MTGLWLGLIIVDVKSKRVLYRAPEQPLPARLRVSQLRSYLEQRFGPPLSDHVPGQAWLEFDNPSPSPEARASRILALPLVADPQTNELVSVFQGLEQFDELAVALGADRGADDSTSSSRIWVGPLFDHRFLLQTINDLAARAMRASLIAAGLKGGVDRVLEANVDDPIPTGAFRQAMRELNEAVTEAIDTAECAIATRNSAVGLAADLEDCPDPTTIESLLEVERYFSDQCTAALAAAERSERLSREIAQIAFGISACAGGLAAELLDRASVSVLHPPSGCGVSIPLRADGLRLRATSDLELRVDLAGAICRILVDRGTLVRLRLRDRVEEGVDLEIEDGDTLLVTARTHARRVRRRLLESDGWGEGEKGVFTRRWASPVTAIQPARLVSRTLFGLFEVSSVDALEVSVGPVAISPDGADFR